MFKDYPDMLSPKEAMVALGIGKNMIYHLLNTGEIKATKIGKKFGKSAENLCLTMSKHMLANLKESSVQRFIVAQSSLFLIIIDTSQTILP